MNPSARLLCPVCKDNIKVNRFEYHVKTSGGLHKHLIPFMTKKFFDIIYIASDLKGNSNNIYFNWKYYIMSSYNLTENDINIYDNAVKKVKELYGKLLFNELRDEIRKIDERYNIDIISDSLVGLNFRRKLPPL